MKITKLVVLLISIFCCGAFGFVCGDWWRTTHASPAAYLNNCIIARIP